jgi:hypothetical protein
MQLHERAERDCQVGTSSKSGGKMGLGLMPLHEFSAKDRLVREPGVQAAKFPPLQMVMWLEVRMKSWLYL